jgi:hypothetical protein
MECVGVCGGMDYDFFKQITANSNEHARLNMSNEGVFAGKDWTNVTVEEFVHFLGILLKMSVDNRELGGYSSYFTSQKCVNLG